MKIEAIRAKASELGVSKPEKMKMPALIRAIQEAEGNPPSFGNNDGKCPYTKCCWWDDCIKEYKRSH